MKVTTIFGGPRLGKNTDQALSAFLSGFLKPEDHVARYNLKEKNIRPCVACYGCSKDGNCVIRDDMDELYAAFEDSEVIILATPFFFNSVSAISKMMIDRCQRYWTKKFMLNQRKQVSKYGICIVTAGALEKKGERVGVQVVVDLFFKAIGAEFKELIFIDGTDEKSIIDRPEVLENLKALGMSHRIRLT